MTVLHSNIQMSQRTKQPTPSGENSGVMQRLVRPSTAEDLPSILELFVSSGLRPNIAPPELEWKYWQPRGDWPGPRSLVLADGEELLAHGALIPGRCAWSTHRIGIVHVIDWAARASAVGAGVALMRHIGRATPALLAIGGSAQTQQILPFIGFRDLGCITGYVRTLHPLRLLRAAAVPTARRLPRVARSIVWKLAAPARGSAGWQTRALERGEVEAVAAVLPAPVRGMAIIERSVELFRYMLSCPVVPLRLFAVEKSDRTRGYFLLAAAPGQVRIADCWMDSDDPADWRAMILCAVERAKQDPQAAEVVIWANDPLLAGTLIECGFHARHQIGMRLRARDAAASPPLPLRVQMLDSDAAFLHAGIADYWA